MKLNSRLAKISYVGAGLVAGAVLATTLGAQAATVSPSASGTTSSTAAADPHPGDNGADGVPEANEVHGGGGGRALGLSGTVTAVGASSVTIKTATATTTYSVTSASDIDKNGEAAVSALVVGDKVTFSVDRANAKQIDKLHTGDETKNMPARPANPGTPNAG
ncbi:hypothetical protein BJ986_001969 [Phycicoccus badiiscoriae]|uniref:DUF5666 domain-containing protein n=1 Tax=Pedococcus badiiscoriae TaxID=642776 RepID=A0A852WQH5_9MICO|nr:hypothetical protein [Pedococcus badiiscoriae]NYG07482.1 hypothetical protein [Pedococcus badiiscoriae]